VTTYPAYIVFDTAIDGIYPNMGANAGIITEVKDNVVMVPNAAVKTTNGQTTVSVMKNGNVSSVDVTVGVANDSETEITSGVNDGDTVVTGTSVTGTSTTSTATSPFSSLGGRGFGGGGGGAVRTGGR
jgi:hypothetical protein